jgi:hypothetical protein
VDDEVGNRGSVVFSVRGGSGELYNSGRMTGADPGRPIAVDLSGQTEVRLVVTDAGDGIGYDHADWADARLSCESSSAPTVTFSAPADGATFGVGDTVNFASTAVDPEDGAVPNSSLSWRIVIHHCPSGNCHSHFLTTGTGGAGSFVVPDHGDDVHLTIDVTATDSEGNVTTASRRVDIATSTLTLRSEPSGRSLTYNGTTVVTPFSVEVGSGAVRTIGAPSPQGGYTFESWSDGGAATHDVTVGAADVTFTARFGAPAGTTQYVSDLVWLSSTNGWGPVERDRSNGEQGATDGRAPLRINGVSWVKGLGTHASSVVRFAVPNGCSTFSAQVGVDDEVLSNGSVVFEVWNDSTSRLYTSPVKRGGESATPVSVDVAGVSTLRLVVTDGGNGAGYDHANWADAKLICSGEAPPADTTPPVITALGASGITSTSASVSWTTDEAATSRVDYGTTAALGSSTTTSTVLTTSHARTITGLEPDTTYFYRVRSADSAGNERVADGTFVTPPSPVGTSTMYVSDLTWLSSTNGWGPVERDRSNGERGAADGRAPLTINGATWTKGLGAHATSTIRLNVPSGCTTFSALVGVDDEVGNNGSVVFEVWNDTAARLSQSPLKTGADAASVINADISGVAVLRLVVTDGGNGAGSDHANWADARFICGDQAPPPPDTAPPTITGIDVTDIATSSASITWSTDEPATSRVDYGTTATLGFSTTTSVERTTVHARQLTGLSPNTEYFFRVRSTDGEGNERVSDLNTFQTQSAPPGVSSVYSSYSMGPQTHGVAAADLNSDGRIDLVSANSGVDTIAIRLGVAGGGFGPASSYPVGDQPKSVLIVDVNGDGRDDVVVPNQGTNDLSVLSGLGDGTLAPQTRIATCSGAHEIAAGDFDGDGRPDVVVACWGGSVAAVHLNTGAGGFGPRNLIPTGRAPHSVVVFDADGDGNFDFATADRTDDSVTVMLGRGDGAFDPAPRLSVGARPHSIRSGDVDGDGVTDLVTANDQADSVSVLVGRGDGTFEPAVSIATGQTPKSVVLADIDGNEALDIITSNINRNYPKRSNPDGNDISLLMNTGLGSFEAVVHLSNPGTPFAIAAADTDGDGMLNFITANWWTGDVKTHVLSL